MPCVPLSSCFSQEAAKTQRMAMHFFSCQNGNPARPLHRTHRPHGATAPPSHDHSSSNFTCRNPSQVPFLVVRSFQAQSSQTHTPYLLSRPSPRSSIAFRASLPPFASSSCLITGFHHFHSACVVLLNTRQTSSAPLIHSFIHYCVSPHIYTQKCHFFSNSANASLKQIRAAPSDHAIPCRRNIASRQTLPNITNSSHRNPHQVSDAYSPSPHAFPARHRRSQAYSPN